MSYLGEDIKDTCDLSAFEARNNEGSTYLDDKLFRTIELAGSF